MSTGSTFCIDAVEGMKHLSNRSIGAVITDPPFHTSIGRNSGPRGGAGVDPWTQTLGVSTVADMVLWTLPIAEQVGRVLRPGGAMVVMGGSQSLAAWELSLPRFGCHWMAEMTVLWNTGKPRNRNFGGITTSVRWYVKEGARHTFNSGDRKSIYSNVLVATKIPMADREHPAQKPVELTNVFVSLLTDPADIVLDPFCGAGSTLVSAAMCGRQWMGFDTDAHWAHRAGIRAQRWELEQAHLRPIYLWVNNKLYEIEGE